MAHSQARHRSNTYTLHPESYEIPPLIISWSLLSKTYSTVRIAHIPQNWQIQQETVTAAVSSWKWGLLVFFKPSSDLSDSREKCKTTNNVCYKPLLTSLLLSQMTSQMPKQWKLFSPSLLTVPSHFTLRPFCTCFPDAAGPTCG